MRKSKIEVYYLSHSAKKDISVQSLTKLFTLLLLQAEKEPTTGYQVLKYLEKELDTTASPNTLYAFLHDLEDAGYIKEVNVEDKKRSLGYRTTDEGKKFIESIIARFDSLLEMAIKPKLTVCAHCHVQLYNNFHTEKIDDKTMNFCCKHCAKAYQDNL